MPMQVLQRCSLCGQYSVAKVLNEENIAKELSQFKNLRDLSAQFKDAPQVYKKLSEFNNLANQMKRSNKNIIMNIKESEKIISFMLGKLNQKCDYCSERINLNYMEESVLIEFGEQLYKEYYTVMTRNGNSLPKSDKVRITVVKEEADYLGSCDYNEKLKIWIVEINAIAGNSKHYAKVIFAHEFGHLFFDYDKNTGGKKADTSLWNSEYFAAEVEIQKLLKFNGFNTDEKLRAFDKVVAENNTLILADYLSDTLKSYMMGVKEHCDEGLNIMNIISIIRSDLWYRSKINFVNKYIDSKYAKYIPDITTIEKYLEQRYGSDDEELCKQLKRLNDYIVGSYIDIDSDLLTEIADKINFQLNSHIRGQEHFRSREAMFKHALGDNFNSELMDNTTIKENA